MQQCSAALNKTSPVENAVEPCTGARHLGHRTPNDSNQPTDNERPQSTVIHDDHVYKK